MGSTGRLTERALTEGEAWTREQLALLLDGRFAPAAVARFLAASQRRAGEVRRLRPALGRQARGWMTIGAAGWLAPPVRRHARRGLAWWAAAALMLDWHLGMAESESGEPRSLGPADALTLARVWMAPIAWETPSPLLVLAAGATDVLDGRVARATRTTRLGRDLEGLADSAFTVAVLRGALKRGTIGRAAAGGELARLAAGFAYALVVYFGATTAPDPAVTRAARLTTPMRAGGLVAAGLGHRRLAGALLAGGSLWSAAAVLRALGGRPSYALAPPAVPKRDSPSGSRPSRPT